MIKLKVSPVEECSQLAVATLNRPHYRLGLHRYRKHTLLIDTTCAQDAIKYNHSIDCIMILATCKSFSYIIARP